MSEARQCKTCNGAGIQGTKNQYLGTITCPACDGKGKADSQRTPVPNAGRPIADMVCEDIQKRAEHGLLKYGVKLQAHNGRKALQDAYEEALDLCHYLKQRLVEEQAEVERVQSARALTELQFGSNHDMRGEDR